MGKDEIIKRCEAKEKEILDKYFGNFVKEAALERPETIGEYTKDLPLKIGAEYQCFLRELWKDILPEELAPDELKGDFLVLEERKLLKLMTDDDREAIRYAYKDAKRRTLWERITKTNHEDVTYYKGWLKAYTRDLLFAMRHDFIEEVTGKYIKNKTFEKN